MQDCKQVLNKAMQSVGDDEKNQFYGATLGFYKAFMKDAFGSNAAAMVKVWNDFATSPDGLGCPEVPGSELLSSTLPSLDRLGS
jgi:ATP-dependent RNA helicase MSS116